MGQKTGKRHKNQTNAQHERKVREKLSQGKNNRGKQQPHGQVAAAAAVAAGARVMAAVNREHAAVTVQPGRQCVVQSMTETE